MHPCRSLFWITGIILFVVGVLLEEAHLLSALFGTMPDSLSWAAHIQWLINIQYEGPVVSEGLSDSTAPCSMAPCGASWGWGLQCSSTSLTYSFFHRCWFQELSHLDLPGRVCYLGDSRCEIRPLNTQESNVLMTLQIDSKFWQLLLHWNVSWSLNRCKC